MELLIAGAMLHDIGRARTHSIHHAVAGADIARELELPQELVLIIERHIGAGVTDEDARKYKLPNSNYMPETVEQKIIASSDNLFEGDKRCSIERSVQIFINRGLPEVAERVRELHHDVSELAGIDIDNIK
jgi:tRNA (cytidine56-2'-O)-methyltransferase